MNLRPYQTTSINQIREHFKEVKKVLLWLDTGAGKTVIFSYILKTMSARGKKAMMVVRGRQLVQQAHERLVRENVRHGVRMAGHFHKDFSANVQICSIDTLQSRGKKFFPEAELIVIDEVHMATSKGYKDLLAAYPNAFVLGVTATPWAKDGLAHVADRIVHPVTMTELIEQGFLVPARYFAPSEPDMKGVKSSAGDFVNEQIHMKMNTLTGNIVETWVKYSERRPTLLFACNIRHSMELRDAFNQAGFKFVHVEAETSASDRREAIEALKSGRIDGICNVGIFCTGVDIPILGCGIMARPTKSYSLYLQQAGRFTRPAENKKDFILLDHAGNVLRHGFIHDQPKVDLDSDPKEKSLNVKRCKECFSVYIGPWCPDCGPKKADIIRSSEIMNVEGELVEMTGLSQAIKISRRFEDLKRERKSKGYKRAWMYFRLRDEFGDDVAKKIMPQRIVPPWVSR